MGGRTEHFGAHIRMLRESREWSRYKAANAIQVSSHRLAELEVGRSRGTDKPTRPSLDTVARIAAVYGVPRDHLLELAGYAAERPPMGPDEGLLLDLFRAMNDERRRLVLAAVKAIAGEP